ncbi:MAG TPA: DUF454 domain-containing protein [Thermococcus paralvinellae]|uniref:DUF454 domain-containing protein n=1 Tax=Thermococcus paralvinellae TaxID=582419 RepID=A0A832ZFJ3_9EURY|nr:DUF454 domain-containing protein [Thermococcus paralvinellae]
MGSVKPIRNVGRENKWSSRLIRLLFVMIGTIFVGLAYIATLLPVVPQSPFLLIALACYSKGSERLENWLLNNRLFGRYLKNIREKGFFKEKIWKNKWFWGIVIAKVSILGIVLYHIFGIKGVIITLLIGTGKLALFLTSIYISERIWRTPISRGD